MFEEFILKKSVPIKKDKCCTRRLTLCVIMLMLVMAAAECTNKKSTPGKVKQQNDGQAPKGKTPEEQLDDLIARVDKEKSNTLIGNLKKALRITASSQGNVIEKCACTFLVMKDNGGKKLFEAGEDRLKKLGRSLQVNEKDNNGYTASIRASKQGYKDVVELLIYAGAEKEAKTNKGYTALICASKQGKLEVVNALIKAGAEKEAKTNKGWTALICASKQGHLGVVNALIKAGAEKEAKTNKDWTALICASKQGHLGVVHALIKAGAKIRAATKNQWTALKWASKQGHLGVVNALIEAGLPLYPPISKAELIIQDYNNLIAAAKDKNPLFTTLTKNNQDTLDYLNGKEYNNKNVKDAIKAYFNALEENDDSKENDVNVFMDDTCRKHVRCLLKFLKTRIRLGTEEQDKILIETLEAVITYEEDKCKEGTNT